MNALCYETINRSPYIVPEQIADLPAQILAASAAGFPLMGIDVASIAEIAEGLRRRWTKSSCYSASYASESGCRIRSRYADIVLGH